MIWCAEVLVIPVLLATWCLLGGHPFLLRTSWWVASVLLLSLPFLCLVFPSHVAAAVSTMWWWWWNLIWSSYRHSPPFPPLFSFLPSLPSPSLPSVSFLSPPPDYLLCKSTIPWISLNEWMALNSLICADVPLRNCSLTHSYRHTVDADMQCSSESRVTACCCSDAKDKVLYTFCLFHIKKYTPCPGKKVPLDFLP